MNTLKFKLLLASFLLLLAPTLSLAAPKTDITWLGHSGFRIVTPGGKVLFIDPWLTNSGFPKGGEMLESINRADLIFVTHGHGDHIGNAPEIAKKTGAKLVATFDLGKALVKYAGFPEKQFGTETAGNFGGQITLLDGEVKVAFIPAVHSSSVEVTEGAQLAKQLMFGGNPGGFVLTIKDGPIIYHTGDTDLFGDMALVRDFGQIDIMMLCIGDKFTMGPRRAAQAVRLVEPVMAIPMHYAATPAWIGTDVQFIKEVRGVGGASSVNVMKAGETISWERKPSGRKR